jgi:hypothetical protein
MLTLLTYGDTNGVGPGIWNEWKDALLWELYLKTSAKLDPHSAGEVSRESLKEKIGQMLASEIDDETVSEHFDSLPEGYARNTPSQVIIEHIRLAVSKVALEDQLARKCAGAMHRSPHLCSKPQRSLCRDRRSAHVTGCEHSECAPQHTRGWSCGGFIQGEGHSGRAHH